MDSSQDPGTPQVHELILFVWHWVSISTLGTLGNALPLSYAPGALLLQQQGQPLFLQDRGDGIANGVYTESWHLLKVSQHNLSGTQERLNKPLGQDTC